MGILTGSTDYFGLDIGASAIRVVQMKGGKSKTLVRYGSIDIDSKIARSDSPADQQKLGAAIKQVVAASGISTPNVAVGLPSNRVFMTVVDIDRLSPQELEHTIKYQADSLIPTPIDESKIDWALLGDSPKEQSKVEVLLASVENSFVEKRLDLLESLKLNVVAFEPESVAIARSLLQPGVNEPQLVIDMGKMDTDLVITMNGAPRLIRSIPVGTDAIIRAAVQNLGIDEKQAEQFVFKFGLNKEKLEGQIFGAVIGTVDTLLSELEKSSKFFQARYNGQQVSRIVVSGGAAILPEFPLYIANKTGIAVEVGNAWRNVSFVASKQNELLNISNKFAAAAGLAERIE